MPNRFSLSEIASRFHLSLDGDDAEIEGVGTLSGAEPTEISFLSNPGYRGELAATRAAAVILKPADVAACPTRSLVTDEPYLAFARVAALFEPDRSVPAGIHPSAVVDPTARLGAGVRIGPLAVVGARCEIGDGCTIGPGTVIEPGSCLGRDCSLDLLIDDIRAELRQRPYELVSVAGGWQHRTKKGFAVAIRRATGLGVADSKALSQTESLVLLCIGYFQPITRAELGQVFGKEISRDTIAHLRKRGFISAGPRSPQPGASAMLAVG